MVQYECITLCNIISNVRTVVRHDGTSLWKLYFRISNNPPVNCTHIQNEKRLIRHIFRIVSLIGHNPTFSSNLYVYAKKQCANFKYVHSFWDNVLEFMCVLCFTYHVFPKNPMFLLFKN